MHHGLKTNQNTNGYWDSHYYTYGDDCKVLLERYTLASIPYMCVYVFYLHAKVRLR